MAGDLEAVDECRENEPHKACRAGFIPAIEYSVFSC